MSLHPIYQERLLETVVYQGKLGQLMGLAEYPGCGVVGWYNFFGARNDMNVMLTEYIIPELKGLERFDTLFIEGRIYQVEWNSPHLLFHSTWVYELVGVGGVRLWAKEAPFDYEDPTVRDWWREYYYSSRPLQPEEDKRELRLH